MQTKDFCPIHKDTRIIFNPIVATEVFFCPKCEPELYAQDQKMPYVKSNFRQIKEHV